MIKKVTKNEGELLSFGRKKGKGNWGTKGTQGKAILKMSSSLTLRWKKVVVDGVDEDDVVILGVIFSSIYLIYFSVGKNKVCEILETIKKRGVSLEKWDLTDGLKINFQ